MSFALPLLSLILIAAQSLQSPQSPDEKTSANRPIYLPAYSPSIFTIPLYTEPSTSNESLSAVRFRLVDQNDILAFYGHPNSRQMGILGRYSKEELDEKLTALAAEYDAVNGDRGIIKAFYLIYGTVWPGGEIGIMSDRQLKEYIDYAADHDMIVFIDHQIGRYDPVASLGKMFRWLAYPNVHLALDPEWRTTRPMKEIGSVTADELNGAMRAMEEYMTQNGIAGERLMVVHQFNAKMISERNRFMDEYERVRLIHCADGFGTPGAKRSSYAYNAEATNIPDKGFKLFYNFEIPGAGYDRPLLTPVEVCALSPRPMLIMYQ